MHKKLSPVPIQTVLWAHIKFCIQMCTHAERDCKKYECTFCRISNKKSTFNPQALNYQRIVDIPNHQTGYISKYYSDPQFDFHRPLSIASIVVEILKMFSPKFYLLCAIFSGLNISYLYNYHSYLTPPKRKIKLRI